MSSELPDYQTVQVAILYLSSRIFFPDVFSYFLYLNVPERSDASEEDSDEVQTGMSHVNTRVLEQRESGTPTRTDCRFSGVFV